MAKTLIRNGTVMTMNDGLDVFPGGYVYIDGSRIAEVGVWPGDGSKDALLALADTVIDAAGKAVIPGLVNCHTHLFQTFMRGVSDDLPLAQWLRQIIWPASLAMEEEDFYLAAMIGCIENLKSGATYVMDHHYIHTHPGNDEGVLEAMRQSGIRGHMARGGVDLSYEPRLRESAEEIFANTDQLLDKWQGEGEGRIAIAMGPLNLYGCSEEFLRLAAKYGERNGLITHIHLSETREQIENTLERFGLRNVELAEEVGLLGRQTQVVHGVWLNDAELDILARREATVVHCPVSNMYLASGVARVPDMLERGINVALGTDGPGSNNCQDNLEVLKFAACLHKVDRLDSTLMPPMGVLRMGTRNGAKAVGREEDLGSLEPGKKADIVVIELQKAHIAPVHRVSSAIVYNANGNDVDTVLVNGRVVVSHGRCTLVDEMEIIRRAQARVDVLRSKLAPSYPVFGSVE
ncbi:amidohydrolase family protein [Paenibacillus sacheonensis]|uniref:amidohydrolase family protein n=1 Tax=Paenibacillus sacheonensis TaxID=742054 RepID=UPI001EF92CA9|nr:amidohydrolase [Paenibacillus sacheonensis]MBM7563424.1 5-methylthioadenosine/S-adenosylhomocysteine deaminase [Paenibacillus sacheonensis]